MSTETSRVQLGDRVPLPPSWARKATSIVGFFVVWWACVRFGVLGFDLFIGPVPALTALAGFLLGEPLGGSRTIYYHAAYSTARVVAGVGIAALLAIPLGLLIGTRQRWEDALNPALEALRPIPPVAWVPFSILLFPALTLGGLTVNPAVVFVVFIGAFFPILVNTTEGVRELDTEYRRAAETLGADSVQRFRHVVFPATLPSILTGVSLGIGLGWISVVAAEIIAGNYGLGYITYQAYRLLNTEVIAVGIIAIGALGYGSSALVQRAGDRAMPWTETEQ
jgi:NitT/TauT family transport system permease protein